MSNALIIHGGAPTAVINASLYGAVEEAKKYPQINKIFAAIGGSGGVLRRQFLDMKTVPQSQLQMLPYTPASAIGTSRDHLEPQDYAEIAQIIKENDIRFVFFNGGNGSMDTCGKVYSACKAIGADVQVVGIPKTIDNDISVTDHAPGFGSAARYVAATVSEICQDVQALPIHVCVLETMGRNAGWITAAAALAREAGSGPDMIYLPEIAFDESRFLSQIEALHQQKKGIVVVVSEGLKNKDGDPIVAPIFKMDRAVYYGDVSAHLANLVIKNLGIKARSEKPGLCGRASIAFQSDIDREEAILAGKTAVEAAIAGQTGVMVGFQRIPGAVYQVKPVLIPIQQVMLEERLLPTEYISADGNDVTPEFCNWCRPLIGGPLRNFVSLRP
ncbi:MAG: diphosphate--fructose-6-phosphate 1-phosphotransferase [Oscillospiraceae bacterium]